MDKKFDSLWVIPIQARPFLAQFNVSHTQSQFGGVQPYSTRGTQRSNGPLINLDSITPLLKKSIELVLQLTKVNIA